MGYNDGFVAAMLEHAAHHHVVDGSEADAFPSSGVGIAVAANGDTSGAQRCNGAGHVEFAITADVQGATDCDITDGDGGSSASQAEQLGEPVTNHIVVVHFADELGEAR